MAIDLQNYNGQFLIKLRKPLNDVPSRYQDAAAVKQFVQLLNTHKVILLNLSAKNGSLGEILKGTIFLDESYKYRLDGCNIRPEYDLDGTIYFGQAEIEIALKTDMYGLNLFICALPPENESTTEDFLVYQCAFKRYIPPKPKTKYPLATNLIGWWRNEDNYASNTMGHSFSGHTITYLELRDTGIFVWSKRTIGSSSFSDNMGNYMGSNSVDSGLKTGEYGEWGIVESKLYLEYPNNMCTHCAYEVSDDSLLLYYNNGDKQFFKRA